MGKQEILRNLAGIMLVAILFTPQGSNLSISFLFGGLILGSIWFLMQ